jgi:adenine-specific DNA-methyltransferase
VADLAPTRLVWPGQEQCVAFEGAGAAVLVSPDDPRLEAQPLTSVARYGERSGDPDGLLAVGDSLPVLRSLGIGGEVRLAYLDPPFNTKERSLHYDDALDRPIWLAMMRDRLSAVNDLLAPDGSLWVHCDDREQAYLRILLDELMGVEAFVATIVWQRRYSRENRRAIGAVHDYIHVYAPLGLAWKETRNRLPRQDRPGTWRNPDNDPRGPWSTVALTAQGGHGTAEQFYAITTPSGKVVEPPPGSCWRVTHRRLEAMIQAGEIWFGPDGSNVPRRKVYLSEAKGLVPWTWWPHTEVGHNDEARREMRRLFPDQEPFATSKPERLLARIVEVATNPGDLVLDCFLGSGTTAAVAHKLGRRWIGVELRPEIVDSFALPRLRAVVEGRDEGGVSALREGGSFEYRQAPARELQRAA